MDGNVEPQLMPTLRVGLFTFYCGRLGLRHTRRTPPSLFLLLPTWLFPDNSGANSKNKEYCILLAMLDVKMDTHTHTHDWSSRRYRRDREVSCVLALTLHLSLHLVPSVRVQVGAAVHALGCLFIGC